MPGRRGIEPVNATLCRRCQINEPAVTVRTEPLCKPCFCKYVSTKAIKRMESFRVRHSERGQERILLLPLSFGAGSIALLHVLSEHLKGQVEKTGRSGFRLHVLHVDEAPSGANISTAALLEQVKQRYPEHVYSTCMLSHVFSLEDLSTLLEQDHDGQGPFHPGATNLENFEQFMASLDSATSRADATQILKRRLIVHFAKQHKCEAILWGDSTTRLAERTLAETAKGRGLSLPWLVADGESPHGVQIYYPMRELLSKEIAAFASLVDPPLDDLVLEDDIKRVSTKNTTIDDLMRQYFESVERDYPSIVANVVRTTGKLRAAPLSDVEKQCELCDMPLAGQAPERSRLCYGCIRALPRAAG